MRFLSLILLSLIAALPAAPSQPFYDRTHDSAVFGEPRHYRILLPPEYDASNIRYPVIYYFHGHSDRYTVELYDKGADTIPKMADFVAHHPVIVVCVDGYVAEDYTGFYGGAPWSIFPLGKKDFGPYFLELIRHIDSTFRTLTDRRHRATSGLSMGGFMSLYLSARYPEFVGSASAFNPGAEFYTGEAGRRVLWRSKDHVAAHTQTMVRLIRASGDYISQYHEETRDAYARAEDVDFEFRQDEYHRHWATSIGETFDFHMRAFSNTALDNVPETWSYRNAYRSFDVRGYRVQLDAAGAGLTYLDNVRQGSLRILTRQWAPDGPPIGNARIALTTAPLYSPNETYRILDYSLQRGKTEVKEVRAAADGSLSLSVDGTGHQIGIAGPGTGEDAPILLPVTAVDKLRVAPGQSVAIPIKVYNPRGVAMRGVTATLSSDYPTVEVLRGQAAVAEIGPGGVADLAGALKARFTAGTGYFASARLSLKLVYDEWHEAKENIDILIEPEKVSAPAEFVILDGRSYTFSVFRQKGNQGGGGPVERSVTEGKGNGNGIFEPGEEATIWVKLPQGMDPFDKGNWYRTKIRTDSPWVREVQDIEEPKQREWTAAMERTSVIRLSEKTPPGASIPLLLDNESWSFTYTPDVRYGAEKLYQAFQLHTHHLHRIVLKVGKPARGN